MNKRQKKKHLKKKRLRTEKFNNMMASQWTDILSHPLVEELKRSELFWEAIRGE